MRKVRGGTTGHFHPVTINFLKTRTKENFRKHMRREAELFGPYPPGGYLQKSCVGVCSSLPKTGLPYLWPKSAFWLHCLWPDQLFDRLTQLPQNICYEEPGGRGWLYCVHLSETDSSLPVWRHIATSRSFARLAQIWRRDSIEFKEKEENTSYYCAIIH